MKTPVIGSKATPPKDRTRLSPHSSVTEQPSFNEWEVERAGLACQSPVVMRAPNRHRYGAIMRRTVPEVSTTSTERNAAAVRSLGLCGRVAEQGLSRDCLVAERNHSDRPDAAHRPVRADSPKFER
ncbi:hypothetical protein MRX96_055108 [Rhipicephalus microplus]